MLLYYLFTFTKPFGKISRPLRAYLEAEQRPEMLIKVLWILVLYVVVYDHVGVLVMSWQQYN